MILFQAILFSLGVGVFSIENKKPEYVASLSEREVEEISTEPPADLDILQKAGSGQLDYWAEHLENFDGREFNIITPARSQGNREICWAYAAVGAVEASILREGIDETATKDTLDFDEMITAYTRFNRDGGTDPLLLTTNDKFGGDGTWNKGDFSGNALSIMTQGYTLVNDNHFHSSIDESTIKSKLAQSKYYVQSYSKISTEKDAIKRAILQYGAVTFDYSTPAGYTKYYRSGEPTINHSSIIVGWDDNMDRTSFAPNKPTGNGAWIVKNSWGDYGTDKNGTYCFYISYELPIRNIYAVDMAMREDYQNIYHYDGQIVDSQRNYLAEAQAAIYEAKLSSTTKQEQLKAVMISTTQGNLDVDVKVYKNLKVNPGNVNDKNNNPVQDVAAAEVKAHLDNLGMHTIDLVPINLEQGEYFSIVVSCQNEFKSYVPISCAVDGGSSLNDMTYYCYNGEWTSYKKSNYYADTSTDNMSARIRAITNTVERETPLGNDLQYARVEIPNRLIYYAKGESLLPEVRVYMGETLLELGQDYTILVQNNNRPGMATIKITGMNTYYGTRITYFEIAKLEEPPGAISGTLNVYNNIIYLYDIPIPANWEWVDTNKKLDFGKTYWPVSLKYVGEDKDFYQKTTCDFYVNKINQAPPPDIDISTAVVQIMGKYSYTGQPIIPTVKVTRENVELQEGIDYILTFENNTRAGTATVIVTGNGRYMGSQEISFTISQAERPAVNTTIHCKHKVTKLSDISLPKGFVWENENMEITENEFVAKATYQGEDKDCYEITELSFTIIIEPEEQQQSSPLIWLALAIPAAAMLAGAVVFVVLQHRKKEELEK